MHKHWEGTVHVDAPVERVFAYLADFERHPEWDRFTVRVEQTSPGDASGVGAEWRVYERLNVFSQGSHESRFKNGTGLAKREVRELVPNQRLTWHTHPVPKVGVSADFTFEVEPDGQGTKVTQRVQVNVPGLVDAVGRLVAKNLDAKQQAQWQAGLAGLKQLAESAAREPAAV